MNNNTKFDPIKSKVENKIVDLAYSGIEWRPSIFLNLEGEKKEKIFELLNLLDELEDVQKVYANINLEKANI